VGGVSRRRGAGEARRGAGAATYAVDSPRGQAGVALAADHLVAVVLGGKGLERGLNDTATETEDQVQSRLLLDVVVGQGAAVLELLAGEDQALLVRGNALLVLDLGLDIVCPQSACAPLFPSRPARPGLRRVLRSVQEAWRALAKGCVPMVSEDSTSRVIVLPVTARHVSMLSASARCGLATYGSSRRSAC
jgi:hypothetical protein